MPARPPRSDPGVPIACSLCTAGGCFGFVYFANNTVKGKEMFGATLDQMQSSMAEYKVPEIPNRPIAESEPPLGPEAP